MPRGHGRSTGTGSGKKGSGKGVVEGAGYLKGIGSGICDEKEDSGAGYGDNSGFGDGGSDGGANAKDSRTWYRLSDEHNNQADISGYVCPECNRKASKSARGRICLECNVVIPQEV
jgi:hypothetical protein